LPDVVTGIEPLGTNTTWAETPVTAVLFETVTSPEGNQNTVMRVGTTNGIVYVGRDAGSAGRVNFGAPAGAAPQAVGTLNADGIVFGAGDGAVVFNHTDSNLQFAMPLSGDGGIEVHAGTTWITRDNSVGFSHTRSNFDPGSGDTSDVVETFAPGLSGDTSLFGGTLGLADDFAVGTTAIHGLGNATLAYGTDPSTDVGVSIANTIDVVAPATLALSVDVAEATQTGIISGTGGIDKIGAGILTLTAANTISGPTTVSEGVLRAGAVNTFSASSLTTVAAGATLDLAGYDQTINDLFNAGIVHTGGAPDPHRHQLHRPRRDAFDPHLLGR
jgi:autotransporter-associated beta strand protein